MASFDETYLSADYSKFLSLPALPDKIFGMRSMDVIGYSAVAVAGLVAFVVTKRIRRGKKRRK